MRRLFAGAVALLTSWWFVGIVGWAIVIASYPIADILPVYAE